MAEIGSDKSITAAERVLRLLFDDLLDADRRDNPLLQLGLVRLTARELRRYETEIAHRAIANGATWTEIGEGLGMTRQGAQRRYSRPQANDE